MRLRKLWNITGLGMAVVAMTVFASQTMAQEKAEHKDEEQHGTGERTTEYFLHLDSSGEITRTRMATHSPAAG